MASTTVETESHALRGGPVDETQVATRRLLVVAMSIVVCVSVTYAVPGLHRFRPWVRGDAPPLAVLTQKWGGQELPAFAGAGSAYTSPAKPSASARSELGESVLKNLGAAERSPVKEKGNTARSGERPSGDRPVTDPSNGDGAPAVSIDPSEYADIEIFIEDPTGKGMKPFYDALLETARGKPGAVTRVGHWGDSTIATDLVTYTMRRQLQRRFGDAGHGFILTARGTLPYIHRDVRYRASREWDLRPIVYNVDRDGLYGYGGVQARGAPGASAMFGTDPDAPVGQRVSQFQIFYRQEPRAGRIKYRVDNEPWQLLDLSADVEGDAAHTIEVEDGEHSLQVAYGGGGPVRLYGVVLERNGPGVVYDSLGMVGARARRLLNYEPKHIAHQVQLRGTDLVILGFGGNEADDPGTTIDRYRAEFIEVIDRMRAGREDLGCLVFAPLDQAQRNERGDVQTLRTIPLIVEAQRQAAFERSCAFYNTWAAMGGEGAMERWYRSRPRLSLGDFRHATPAGYEVIARMFYKAMLKGFAEYVDSK